MKREFIGVGSVNNLRNIIQNHKTRNIFLVTGKKSFYSSGAENVILPICADKSFVQFSDFLENPKIEDVIKGVSIFKEAKCDIVIAVGGGSVIDMAKLINIVAHQRSDNFYNIATGKEKIADSGAPLVAIPTTSGSGSEATHFAVVYIGGTKYSLAHEYIRPDYSIVDPSLTYNMPPKLMAISGMDALCQAVESYWSINSTEESRKYASQAIKVILSALEPAVCSLDKNARNSMAIAAHLAGKAINITKTTAAHAISYPITTYFDVPHGHAVALVLGRFFLINSDIDSNELLDMRGRGHLKWVMEELYRLFGCTSSQECCDRWYELMATIGLESDFHKLGICEQSDVNLIIKNVNIERLINNPVRLNDTLLKHVFT